MTGTIRKSADPAAGKIVIDREAHEEWMHAFRNALGSVTIAASTASRQAEDCPDPSLRELLARIENGCERCLELLRTMPLR